MRGRNESPISSGLHQDDKKDFGGILLIAYEGLIMAWSVNGMITLCCRRRCHLKCKRVFSSTGYGLHWYCFLMVPIITAFFFNCFSISKFQSIG